MGRRLGREMGVTFVFIRSQDLNELSSEKSSSAETMKIIAALVSVTVSLGRLLHSIERGLSFISTQQLKNLRTGVMTTHEWDYRVSDH